MTIERIRDKYYDLKIDSLFSDDAVLDHIRLTTKYQKDVEPLGKVFLEHGIDSTKTC